MILFAASEGSNQIARMRRLIWTFSFHVCSEYTFLHSEAQICYLFTYIRSCILLAHYENTPIQIYWKFHHQKLKVFRSKFWYFFIFLLKSIDCGYSLEPPRTTKNENFHIKNLIFFIFLLNEMVLTSTHNLSFSAEIRKIMSIPVNPIFTT